MMFIRQKFAVALLAAGALGAGCGPLEEAAGAEDPGQAVPLRDVAAAPDPDPKPPAVPQPVPAEPTPEPGRRAIDEEAFRALAEEVARLRAELAAARAAAESEAEELADGTADAAEAAEADAEVPLVELARPPEPYDPRDVVVEVEPRDVVVETEVYVDEAPVVIEREVVVERPVYIYEEVIYEEACVYQYVPRTHVHYIGCGHHYYGCHCHPWYWSLGGGGVRINILDVDVDIDHDGRFFHRPRRRAYRNGFADGYEAGHDRHDRYDRHDDWRDGRDGRRLDSGSPSVTRQRGAAEPESRSDAATVRGGRERGASERPPVVEPAPVRDGSRDRDRGTVTRSPEPTRDGRDDRTVVRVRGREVERGSSPSTDGDADGRERGARASERDRVGSGVREDRGGFRVPARDAIRTGERRAAEPAPQPRRDGDGDRFRGGSGRPGLADRPGLGPQSRSPDGGSARSRGPEPGAGQRPSARPGLGERPSIGRSPTRMGGADAPRRTPQRQPARQGNGPQRKRLSQEP